MPTQHLIRFIALVPAARRNAINTWIRNNLDPTGDDWLTIGLNASGTGTPTHYWFNAALTLPEFKKLANQLLSAASIALPADWDTKTADEKIVWLRGQYNAVRTATGVRMRIFRNDQTWDNPDDELALAGLQRITPTLSVQGLAEPSIETSTPKQGIDWQFVVKGAVIGSAIAAGAIGAALAAAEILLK